MVKLKNIKKNDSVIECSIIPEDSVLEGRLSIDIQTGETVAFTLPEGYEWCLKHVEHAKQALIDLERAKELPKEKTIMWC